MAAYFFLDARLDLVAGFLYQFGASLRSLAVGVEQCEKQAKYMKVGS